MHIYHRWLPYCSFSSSSSSFVLLHKAQKRRACTDSPFDEKHPNQQQQTLPPRNRRSVHFRRQENDLNYQNHPLDQIPHPPPPPPVDVANSERLIDVSNLANQMRREVRAYIQSLPITSSPVKLVGVMADYTSSSSTASSSSSSSSRQNAALYSQRIAETLTEDGMLYEEHWCAADEPAQVEAALNQLNQRDDVHGILVFYPIFNSRHGSLRYGPNRQLPTGPKHFLNACTGVHYKTEDDYLRDVVAPSKDVEGLCHDYNSRWQFRARGRNRTNNQVYIPCTALAVLRILHEYGPTPASSTTTTTSPNHPSATTSWIQPDASDNSTTACGYPDDNPLQLQRWTGHTMTVVNRSEIMGRPLAALLALEGATVYSVDDQSILQFRPGGRMRRCPPRQVQLHDCLRESSVVVTGVPSPDFVLPTDDIPPGATVVNVSEYSNVDVRAILQRPDVQLIPHIGKVTCAALEQNLIRLHRNAMELKNPSKK